MTAFETGPYICGAFLCEKVLSEQDGTNSYIRVFDRRTVVAAGAVGAELVLPPDATKVEAILAILLKAGAARGSFQVSLRMEQPSGQQADMGGGTVTFSGGPSSGTNLHVTLQLDLKEEGVYWIDVLGGDERRLMTKVPLEYQVQRFSGALPQLPS